MSATFALVKFKTTGNIYFGCYEGTSDILIPYICTPEECYDKTRECYCSITYCRDLSAQHMTWTFPDGVTDIDEVEIYSDYGGGFYWTGTGSESIKMIKDFLDPLEETYTSVTEYLQKNPTHFVISTTELYVLTDMQRLFSIKLTTLPLGMG